MLVGRAPLVQAAELGFGELHLQGLDGADAAHLLAELLTDLDPGRRQAVDPDAVIEQVGTSPLCVRLAAGVLAKAPEDEALRDLAVQRQARSKANYTGGCSAISRTRRCGGSRTPA